MSIGRNALSNLAGSVLPMIVAFIVVPIYLRYIGIERYGVLAIIWVLLGYFTFFDFGFGRAVTQRMAKLSAANDYEISTLLWTALISTFVLGLVGSFVLWGFADYILIHLITMSESSRSEASSAVTWLLLALPLLLPASVLQGAMQARLRFTELNIIQVLGTTLSQLLPLAIAANGHIELTFLVPAALAARLLTISLLFHQCRRHVPLFAKPVFDYSYLKPLLNYGGWISVMSLLAPLLVTVDRLVIAMLTGAKSVTYYTIPYDLVSRAMVISSSLSNAIFPRLASVDDQQARDIASSATLVLVAIMTPAVIVGLIVVHPFITIWLGRDFAIASEGVAELILVGVWFNALVIPHHARLLTADNPKTVVLVYLIEIPVYFMLLWFGVAYWGVLGAAAAWSLRVLLDTAILLYISGALKSSMQTMTPSLVIVLVCTSVVFFTNEQHQLRWSTGLLLLVISLIKDRKIIMNIYNAIRYKNKIVMS
jgi:O-antigen/teichoic acid export membrane protein